MRAMLLDLEIQKLQYIRAKVSVNKCAETIQGRKLYDENPYFLTILLSISLNKLPWTETRLANRGLKTRLVAPLFPSNGK